MTLPHTHWPKFYLWFLRQIPIIHFSSPTTSLRHYSKRLKYTNSTACYKEQFSHHYRFRDLKGEQIILRNQWRCALGTAIRGYFLQDHQFQQQHLKATHPNSHTYRKQVTSFYATIKAQNRATTKMDRNWPSISNLRKKEQNKRVVDKTNPTCSEQNLPGCSGKPRSSMKHVGTCYSGVFPFFFSPLILNLSVSVGPMKWDSYVDAGGKLKPRTRLTLISSQHCFFGFDIWLYFCNASHVFLVATFVLSNGEIYLTYISFFLFQGS